VALTGDRPSSGFAAKVGCSRIPYLPKFSIGLFVSGILSGKSVKLLTGDAMWPTILAGYA